MRKVKAFYCDRFVKEIKVPESFKGLDIAIEFHREHKLTFSEMTHFLVWYENEWIYGNDYDKRKRKLIQNTNN